MSESEGENENESESAVESVCVPKPLLLTEELCWLASHTTQQVSLYLSFVQDESYTPCQLSIRAGTTFHDLRVPTPTTNPFSVHSLF